MLPHNLLACSQSLPNYQAIDALTNAVKDHDIGANGTAGALANLGLALQGGTSYPAALYPTASLTTLIDQGQTMLATTCSGVVIPPGNDPIAGAAVDIGAYEYGGTPWSAGAPTAVSDGSLWAPATTVTGSASDEGGRTHRGCGIGSLGLFALFAGGCLHRRRRS